MTPTEEQKAITEAVREGHDSLMISAYAGTAKALANNQIVITPNGPIPISDLTENSFVFGRNGLPYNVKGIFPQGIKELYKLTFSDRSNVICTIDHLWTVQRTDDRRLNRFRTVETYELIRKPRMLSGPTANWGDGSRAYWFFPMCEQVEFPNKPLPIDPYLLGVLLGDGSLRTYGVTLSTDDEEILERVKVIVAADYGLKVKKTNELGFDYRISNDLGSNSNILVQQLRTLNLNGVKSQYKFIPSMYKTAGKESRIELLRGLFDTDGYAAGTSIQYTSTSIALIQDVKFLVESLGGTAVWGEFETTGFVAHRLNIKMPDSIPQPFNLSRKLANYKRGQRPPYRVLEKVEYYGEGEATCIKVDSPDSLFLTENFIPTHNTSTLVMSVPGIKVPALALAFNKKIADELKPKLPGNFITKTLNGLGHAAWSRAINRPKLQIDERKLGKLITQAGKDNKTYLSPDQWDETRALVTQAMLSGISPGNEGRPLVPDTEAQWKSLYNGSDQDFPLIYDLAYQALKESIAQARQGLISFDDQIYCPTILGARWPQFPVITVDEAQDLSPLNHRMLSLALAKGGRLIAVGDSRQAIYAFRGADDQSMESMRALSPAWTDLSLTMTFRCPKVIVARQQSHAPGYQAWSGTRDGRFSAELEFDQDDVPSWNMSLIRAELTGLPDPNNSTIAVLCRNNSPLLALAFKLLRRNVGCRMLGRDIGHNLEVLSKKLAPDDSTPITTFLTKLHEWKEHEHSLALANDKPDRADRILDQSESLQAVVEGTGAKTAGDLRAGLKLLFSRTDGLITLSTIHKAKGLEWDLVVHLDPWRIPSRRARFDPVQLQQEKNLLYVCETRTKHTLLNLNLGDFR